MGRHSEEDDAAAKAVAKSTLRQAPAQHVDDQQQQQQQQQQPPRTPSGSGSELKGGPKGNDEKAIAKIKWTVAQAPATFEEESKEEDMRAQENQVGTNEKRFLFAKIESATRLLALF